MFCYNATSPILYRIQNRRGGVATKHGSFDVLLEAHDGVPEGFK